MRMSKFSSSFSEYKKYKYRISYSVISIQRWIPIDTIMEFKHIRIWKLQASELEGCPSLSSWLFRGCRCNDQAINPISYLHRLVSLWALVFRSNQIALFSSLHSEWVIPIDLRPRKPSPSPLSNFFTNFVKPPRCAQRILPAGWWFSRTWHYILFYAFTFFKQIEFLTRNWCT